MSENKNEATVLEGLESAGLILPGHSEAATERIVASIDSKRQKFGRVQRIFNILIVGNSGIKNTEDISCLGQFVLL